MTIDTPISMDMTTDTQVRAVLLDTAQYEQRPTLIPYPFHLEGSVSLSFPFKYLVSPSIFLKHFQHVNAGLSGELLDEQVNYVVGWYRDTLPKSPIKKLALLHLDCDMYESNIVALRSLYARVSPGGVVIIDDYGAVPGCQQAVTDFRQEQGIHTELEQVDWTAVCWQVPSKTDSSPG